MPTLVLSDSLTREPFITLRFVSRSLSLAVSTTHASACRAEHVDSTDRHRQPRLLDTDSYKLVETSLNQPLRPPAAASCSSSPTSVPSPGAAHAVGSCEPYAVDLLAAGLREGSRDVVLCQIETDNSKYLDDAAAMVILSPRRPPVAARI